MPALPGRTRRVGRERCRGSYGAIGFGADVERGARARRGVRGMRWGGGRSGGNARGAAAAEHRGGGAGSVVYGAGDGGDSRQGKRTGRTEQRRVDWDTAAGAAAGGAVHGVAGGGNNVGGAIEARGFDAAGDVGLGEFGV